MWIVYGLLAALTAALMTIIAKVGLQKVDPTLATGIRSFFMFVFMASVVAVTGKAKSWHSLSKRDIAIIAIAAVFGALSWLFYFLGLKETSASKLASLDRLSLPLIILFSILFLSESASWQTVVGALIITGGALLVAWK